MEILVFIIFLKSSQAVKRQSQDFVAFQLLKTLIFHGKYFSKALKTEKMCEGGMLFYLLSEF